MAQTGWNDEKTGGRKSRWTFPLKQKLFCPDYCVLGVHSGAYFPEKAAAPGNSWLIDSNQPATTTMPNHNQASVF